VVNPRLFARACGHEKRVVGREGHDRTKIEHAGLWHLLRRPRPPAIGRTEISPVGAARPCDLPRHRANSAQAFGRVRELDSRDGLSPGGSYGEKNQRQAAHGKLSQKSCCDKK
jgi:hypothetical protein